MKIEHAVITAAGKGQGGLPLQTLVDTDGQIRSALEIVLRETLEAGVKEVALIIRPGDEDAFREAAGDCAESLTFLEQTGDRGYGQAVYTARDYVDGRPFLHLVSDHLYVSHETKGCARQLVEVASAMDCAVSAVQATRETMLSLYGAVGGRKVAGKDGLYEIESVREKPTPTQAEQELVVPGLRAGHYLCFFGMHVLTPAVMSCLGDCLESAGNDPVPLSAALDRMASREKFLACEISGDRQNIGIPYGMFYAQLARALRGVDRDTVLSEMVTMLAGGGGVA